MTDCPEIAEKHVLSFGRCCKQTHPSLHVFTISPLLGPSLCTLSVHLFFIFQKTDERCIFQAILLSFLLFFFPVCFCHCSKITVSEIHTPPTNNLIKVEIFHANIMQTFTVGIITL